MTSKLAKLFSRRSSPPTSPSMPTRVTSPKPPALFVSPVQESLNTPEVRAMTELELQQQQQQQQLDGTAEMAELLLSASLQQQLTSNDYDAILLDRSPEIHPQIMDYFISTEVGCESLGCSAVPAVDAESRP